MMKKKFVYMFLLVGILNADYGDVIVKPSEQRIKNKGIVSDYHNYRMWQDNSIVAVNKKKWKDAIDYCQNLNLSGYSDWRLPNFNELYSITNNRRYEPSIKDAFVNTANQNQSYWTSTTKHRNSSNYTGDAWYVSFLDSTANTTVKTNSFYVRCIRDGITNTHTGLSNASYRIYREIDPLMNNIDVIAFGTTSTGDGVHSDTAGMIYIDSLVKTLLDNNTTYTVEVTGGKYVDFNNTGKWDTTVENNGTLHAYMTGKQLKNGDFRVTILTEIAYQDIKSMLASTALSSLSDADVYSILAQRGQKLLNEEGDLTGDGNIDNEDLIRCNPHKNRDKLKHDYNLVLKPILDTLTQRGAEIMFELHIDFNTGEIVFEEL